MLDVNRTFDLTTLQVKSFARFDMIFYKNFKCLRNKFRVLFYTNYDIRS